MGGWSLHFWAPFIGLELYMGLFEAVLLVALPVRRNLFQILEATNPAVCFKFWKSKMESNFIITFLVLDKMWSTSAGTTERVLKWGS